MPSEIRFCNNSSITINVVSWKKLSLTSSLFTNSSTELKPSESSVIVSSDGRYEANCLNSNLGEELEVKLNRDLDLFFFGLKSCALGFYLRTNHKDIVNCLYSVGEDGLGLVTFSLNI